MPIRKEATDNLQSQLSTTIQLVDQKDPLFIPDKYKVKLTVDGNVQEQEIEVRLDPRVILSEVDLKLQTDNSLACYKAYHDLQAIRESIDAGLTNPKTKWPKGKKERWLALRGEGAPGNPDLLYGSIYESAADKETIVGLQEKWLYMLALLQSVEAKPTDATLTGVVKLKELSTALGDRWNKMK